MRKARILLTCMLFLIVASGLLAWKVARYTANPAFTSTSVLTTRIGSFIVSTIGDFCTTINRFITTTGTTQSLIWYTPPGAVPTTYITLTAPNGQTTIIGLIPCYQGWRFTTTAM